MFLSKTQISIGNKLEHNLNFLISEWFLKLQHKKSKTEENVSAQKTS